MHDLTFLIFVGIVLIILGFFLAAFGMMRAAKESAGPEAPGAIKEGRAKGGGVILIGPVPIVFGTDKRYAVIAMILAVVIMLLAMIFLDTKVP